MTRTLLFGVVALAVLAPTVGWSQTPQLLQQVEKRLAEKQEEAAVHRKQLEHIKDPGQLATEMRQHTRMTEEILELMLERQKLMEAPEDNAQSRGTPGGWRRHHEKNRMQGGGMPGGQTTTGTPGEPAVPDSDMTQMIQRITEHSAHMETIQDRATMVREMLRHQKMLDQMLQLMQ